MVRAFVRVRAVEPNRRGHRNGLFALVNGLGADGELTPAEQAFRRRWNAWYDAALPTPPADVYDRARHPFAASWFRSAATRFLAPVAGYLRILDAHGVAHETVWSDEPGLVLYADEFQVVACAGTDCADAWPGPGGPPVVAPLDLGTLDASWLDAVPPVVEHPPAAPSTPATGGQSVGSA